MGDEPGPAAGEDALSRLLVSFPAGSFVFREGEAGEEMYIIQEGRVEILKQLGAQAKRLAMLDPGDFFGEMSMLENRPRSASARVAADAKLLAVDPSAFDQMLREYPEVAVRMLRSLCHRLRRFEDEAQTGSLVTSDLLGSAPRRETAAPANARLVHASGSAFALPTLGEVVVGRFDPVTQLAPEVDLSALDEKRSLSRRHAKIRSEAGTYLVREEIGTANGTWLDGERLQTGVERPLREGARLRFGLIDLVFHVS